MGGWSELIFVTENVQLWFNPSLWLCDVVVGDGGCLQRVSLELLDSGVSERRVILNFMSSA